MSDLSRQSLDIFGNLRHENSENDRNSCTTFEQYSEIFLKFLEIFGKIFGKLLETS